jgi:hypothetical protein
MSVREAELALHELHSVQERRVDSPSSESVPERHWSGKQGSC